MIQRICILAASLAAAVLLVAGGATPVRAGAPNDEMRDGIMALRGIIDREGAAAFFLYPTRRHMLRSHLGDSWWPADPWTGTRMSPGTSRGRYRYSVMPDRRGYRLVGYLDGGIFVVRGGMPKLVRLAYDHRGEESLNLIRQYIEDWAQANAGVYPLGADVSAEGAVGTQPDRLYWPSNPWDHRPMAQRTDRGSFSYEITPDGAAYTLRLHRDLKPDYVLAGATATDPWQQLLASLEDEILRRSGRIVAGYVDQWSLQHGGDLPQTPDFAADGAVGAAHADWPQDPTAGTPMQPGTEPGAYTYVPGAAGSYTLTIHLYSGAFEAGGRAPSPAPPARGSARSEP